MSVKFEFWLIPFNGGRTGRAAEGRGGPGVLTIFDGVADSIRTLISKRYDDDAIHHHVHGNIRPLVCTVWWPFLACFPTNNKSQPQTSFSPIGGRKERRRTVNGEKKNVVEEEEGEWAWKLPSRRVAVVAKLVCVSEWVLGVMTKNGFGWLAGWHRSWSIAKVGEGERGRI